MTLNNTGHGIGLAATIITLGWLTTQEHGPIIPFMFFASIALTMALSVMTWSGISGARTKRLDSMEDDLFNLRVQREELQIQLLRKKLK